MLSKTVSFGDGKCKVTAIITSCGKDVVVVIGGGVEHIGAVALGIPRPSLRQDGNISASASVLCVVGHKEDLVAREAALQLSSKLNTRVLVSVGLHLDTASLDDINTFEINTKGLLKQIEVLFEKTND